MTWGPTLRAELAELFAEEWFRHPDGREREESALSIRDYPTEPLGDGLCKLQSELLAALPSQPVIARACRTHKTASKQAARALERLGLIRIYKLPRGTQFAYAGELTQRGWQVLLGKRRIRRRWQKARR